MPRVDSDIKLDFKDVLVRPKRSTLKSRADVSVWGAHNVYIMRMHVESCSCMLQVDLNRQFIFKNSKKTYDGIPVVASNMDTVGTFEMAQALQQVCTICI